jgi:signal transduction histidine kinase/ActR/RegA family two-component response regulator
MVLGVRYMAALSSIRRRNRHRWWCSLALLSLLSGPAAARPSLQAIEDVVHADPQAALAQAQRALQQATGPRARLDAIRQAVNALYFHSDPPAALPLAIEGVQLAQELDAPDAQAEMALAQAFVESPYGEPNATAKAFLQQAERIAEQHQLPRHRAYALNELAAHAYEAYDYAGAYELYTRAFAAAEQGGRGFPMAYALLGMLNIETGSQRNDPDWERGLRHMQEAISLVDSERHPVIGMVVFNAVAEAMRRKGDLVQARRHAGRAVELAERTKLPDAIGLALDVLAHVELAQGHADEALQLSSRALALSSFVAGAEVFRIRLALIRARAWALKGQAAPSEAALKEAQRLAAEDSRPEPSAQFHDAAAEVYANLGQYRRAHEHQVELRRLEAETARLASNRVIAELNVKFDVERKEHEAALSQARERSSDAQRRQLAVGLAMALVAAGALAWLLRLQWSQRRQLGVLSQELALRNEALEDMNARRTRLLAAACHDLRQPAHALSLLVDTVSSHDPPAALDSRLASIRHCASSLCDMLSMLMDLHRLEQGHYTPELAPVRLDDVLEEVQLHFTVTAMQKGLSLKVLGCGGVWVLSDANLLRRMLFNLVSNAIKYTPQGSVSVDAALNGGRIRLRVADTGVGIPRERLDDVFTEYVRLDTAREIEGLGIGLAIVKRAAELIGHHLQITSELGRGTTVMVDLPLHIETVPLRPDNALAPQAPPDPGQVIVIVENDRESRQALHDLLASWGYTVVSGEDSAGVRAALRADQTPALIISDLHLGTEDGFTAIQALRRDGRDAPAWLLTGDLDAAVVAQAAEAGVTLLHKPVHTRRLRAAIAAALSPVGTVASPGSPAPG